MVSEHNARWREWVEENEIAPFAVTYEELVADPAAVASAMLAFLGATGDGTVSGELHTRRQADELSEEWIGRYRRQAS